MGKIYLKEITFKFKNYQKIRKIEKNIIEDSEKELEKFHKALQEVIDETNQIVEKARGTEKEIMTAYLMIMQDPSLISETENQIKNLKINAEKFLKIFWRYEKWTNARKSFFTPRKTATT